MDLKQIDDFPDDGTSEDQNKISRITDWILAGLLGLIVSVTITQVFFRYLLNNSLIWTEELVRFLFIWMIFLGSAVNIRDKWHIGVDYLLTVLPAYWKNRVEILNLFFILFFLIFLTVGGFIWIALSSGTRSGVLGLPINWVLYGALPFTSMLGCYYTVTRLKSEFLKINKKRIS